MIEIPTAELVKTTTGHCGAQVFFEMPDEFPEIRAHVDAVVARFEDIELTRKQGPHGSSGVSVPTD